ncbi:MAG: maleylpyruvate isomerase N-terminal domain-containing protein, partial [Gemmatimonadales bacterium]
MSTTANNLADRLEAGARALIALASKLTDDQWKTRIPHDGRTVGVVVHHVASVYPIEIQLAQAIADGNAITGVTMTDVHAMNAGHAKDNADVSKDVAVELLRRNSDTAAAAIRALTDDQLRLAAPASLYAGAPVTSQFVLEDH